MTCHSTVIVKLLYSKLVAEYQPVKNKKIIQHNPKDFLEKYHSWAEDVFLKYSFIIRSLCYYICIFTVRSFVFCCLSGSRGQQPEQGNPDTLLPSYIHQLLRGRQQDVPEPAERYNLSSVSLVCPRVSSRMDMPETPPQGDVLEASWPDAWSLRLSPATLRRTCKLTCKFKALASASAIYTVI